MQRFGYTPTAVSRSTWSCVICGMVKWLPAFGLTDNKCHWWVWMVEIYTLHFRLTRDYCWLCECYVQSKWWVGSFSVGWQLLMNTVAMDPDYEQRLLHVQNGQQSPFGSVCIGFWWVILLNTEFVNYCLYILLFWHLKLLLWHKTDAVSEIFVCFQLKDSIDLNYLFKTGNLLSSLIALLKLSFGWLCAARQPFGNAVL